MVTLSIHVYQVQEFNGGTPRVASDSNSEGQNSGMPFLKLSKNVQLYNQSHQSHY